MSTYFSITGDGFIFRLEPSEVWIEGEHLGRTFSGLITNYHGTIHFTLSAVEAAKLVEFLSKGLENGNTKNVLGKVEGQALAGGRDGPVSGDSVCLPVGDNKRDSVDEDGGSLSG